MSASCSRIVNESFHLAKETIVLFQVWCDIPFSAVLDDENFVSARLVELRIYHLSGRTWHPSPERRGFVVASTGVIGLLVVEVTCTL